MNKPRYVFTTEEYSEVFEFISEGPKGRIKKIVQYSGTNIENVFNLGFGDYDEETGEIDDKTISNNNDSEKILTTVAATVYAFIEKHPGVSIYAIGSNDVRTRLYRIGITNNLEEIQKDFHVFGLKNDSWEKFEKGVNYDAFLVKRKFQ